MALSKEGVAIPLGESTNARGQKIRTHVHQMVQKLIARQAEVNKKS